MDTFLNAFAIATALMGFALGQLVTAILFIIFLIYSPYRWIGILYLIWMWSDRKTSHRGGRYSEWVNGWTWWQYAANYFDAQLVAEDVHLDPERNYLLCCFPHGILPGGLVSAIYSTQSPFKKLFTHKVFLCTLDIVFYFPLARELSLAVGLISCAPKSIRYCLEKKSGGQAVALYVGGSAEALHCKPNTYKFVLKNRKGFVKLAIQAGSPMVPVITLNETLLYDQVTSPTILKYQEYLRKVFQYGMVLIHGRYIVCPNHVQLTVLMGTPIEVEKKENPTMEEIDQLHELFKDRIIQLFEKHKHKYIENADNTFVELI